MIYGIYFLVFFFTATFADVFEVKQIKKYENYIYVISCIFLIMLAGLRVDTGYDFQVYKVIFESVKRKKFLEIFFGGWGLVVEPGYLFINYIFKWMNFQQFIFSVAFFSIILKTTFIYKYIEKKIICLLMYYSMYFLLYDMGIIRQGLAIGILLWGYNELLKESKLKFFILTIIATLIHSSSIVFLIVYFIKNRLYSRRFYLITLMVAIVFSSLNFIYWLIKYIPISFVQNKLFFYMNSKSGESIINSIIKRLVVLILLIYVYDFKDIIKNNKNVIKSFNSFYSSIILSIIFYSIPILGGRGTGALQIMQLILLPICFDGRYIKNRDIFHRLFLLFIVGSFSFYNMYTLINSHDYIPYNSLLK